LNSPNNYWENIKFHHSEKSQIGVVILSLEGPVKAKNRMILDSDEKGRIIFDPAFNLVL